MSMKYKTIYADPPWAEYGGGKIKRGADKHYPLMKTVDIIAMTDFIKSLSDDNCHLYLWVTNNFLPDGLRVMEAWGFRYVTCITWMKDKISLGQYFRGITEHCLFGVKGTLPYKQLYEKRQQGRTGFVEITQSEYSDSEQLIIDGIVFTAPKKEHSTKPQEMRKMIEIVSHAPMIELFARERFDEWDCWGSETNKEIDSYAERTKKSAVQISNMVFREV